MRTTCHVWRETVGPRHRPSRGLSTCMPSASMTWPMTIQSRSSAALACRVPRQARGRLGRCSHARTGLVSLTDGVSRKDVEPPPRRMLSRPAASLLSVSASSFRGGITGKRCGFVLPATRRRDPLGTVNLPRITSRFFSTRSTVLRSRVAGASSGSERREPRASAEKVSQETGAAELHKPTVICPAGCPEIWNWSENRWPICSRACGTGCATSSDSTSTPPALQVTEVGSQRSRPPQMMPPILSCSMPTVWAVTRPESAVLRDGGNRQLQLSADAIARREKSWLGDGNRIN